MSDHPGEATEAARQQALLAALMHPPGTVRLPAGDAALGLRIVDPARTERGLAVYRANAHALAQRALEAACPTLAEMVGADDFAALARGFWHAHPPTRGDICEWGAQLPDWLAGQASLTDWPWLADVARLDLALHQAERAADAEVDAESLGMLGEHEPERLQLVLMPGSGLVVSPWPIVTMLGAHRGPAASRDGRFDAVREALTAGLGETAFVWRRGWRAEACAVDPATAAWMADLMAGLDLGRVLSREGDSAAGVPGTPAFDFAAWLQRALTQGWLKGVELRGD